MKVPCDKHMLIFHLSFTFCRNLRQVGDQSKRHPGYKIGQRARGGPLTSRHVSPLIAADRVHAAGFRLSAYHLLAPVIQRAGVCFHGDSPVTRVFFSVIRFQFVIPFLVLASIDRNRFTDLEAKGKQNGTQTNRDIPVPGILIKLGEHLIK